MNKKKLIYLVLTLGIVVITFFWFLPMLYLIMNCSKENREIFINPWAWPKEFRPDIIIKAWKVGNFSKYYLNSSYVTFATVLLTLFTSILAAYSFSRLKFFGSEVLLMFFLGGLMVTVHTIIVPLYILLKTLNLMNTHAALILVNSGIRIPFSVYFLSMFFRTIPIEIEDAARLDGCSRLGILWKIILPLSRTALAAMIIFVSVFVWNEYILAVTFITSESLKTVPLGLMYFSDQYQTDIGGQISAVLLTSIPMIAIYFIFQKQFVRGITMGAIKG